MTWDWEPRLRALFLLVLMIQPGDGNEGSSTGSCNCHVRFSSTPTSGQLIYIRKYLKVYSRCQGYIRFQLQKSVCGGSQDRWVLDLVNCFDRKECGHDRGKSVHHLLPPSTRIPELTEGAPPDSSSPAEMQSSQQPTLTSRVLSDKELTRTLLRETTTFIPGHSLEAGPEAGANEQQKEEKQEQKKPGAAVGTSAWAPVLSLLAIVFLLTSVLVYVLCRRRKQPPQNSPDLQFYYTPMSQDSNT